MIDYTIFYRDSLPLDRSWEQKYDLFISAYDESERVQTVFQKANASRKLWILHDEYGFSPSEHPHGEIFSCQSADEGEFIFQLFQYIGGDLSARKICIDITGCMRPHIAFALRYLADSGTSKLDVIYSEPSRYKKKESTQFSSSPVDLVRQVVGFEGVVNNDTSNDLLIIGAGYEHELIADVADEKDKARKLILLGLPSLRADMYQQNAWRTQLAKDAIGESTSSKLFVPANDPFVTATVLSELIANQEMLKPITNLYLSPIATKAQTLGFALYYLAERAGTSTSIIFPFARSYARDSAIGIARAWRYVIEFPVA